MLEKTLTIAKAFEDLALLQRSLEEVSKALAAEDLERLDRAIRQAPDRILPSSVHAARNALVAS